MIRECIAKLTDGEALGREEALGAMRDVMAGEATPAQIAGFLTALRIRGESAEVVAGAAQAMREMVTPVDAGGRLVVDTCGTGGDGAHTFNISTAAAFVTAGAGVAVAKHGNRSVSSRCGSADVLRELGVHIELPAEGMAACLADVGIAFLFAPTLHPAMRHAIGPRRELGIRTLFNILGPLSNPAGARYGVLGVYAPGLTDLLAEAARTLGSQHLFVVHGHDGLDEITTTGPSRVAELKDGSVTVYTVTPESLGVDPAAPGDLRGGEPAENAVLLRRVLDGEPGPRRDIVLVNAAAAIVAGQGAPTLRDGVDAAAASIDSGAALAKLEELVRRSNELA